MATKVETSKSVGEGKPKDSGADITNVEPNAASGNARENVNVSGRSVFAVETTAAGIVVRTAFLTQENRLLDMPAVFPDMMYAMDVIDDLRRQVMQHFSQAAQVGAQVIANQARAQQEQRQAEGEQALSGQPPAEPPKA